MGILGSILSKLGFGGEATAAPSAAPTATPPASTPSTPAPASTASNAAPASAAPAATSPAAAAPAAISQVDVVAKLESLAAANPEKLNWRLSIVDLLKLLKLDSSLAARKELAAELHCPPELMGDSAQMNIWLHKAVLQKLAANGGKVPEELLH